MYSSFWNKSDLCTKKRETRWSLVFCILDSYRRIRFFEGSPVWDDEAAQGPSKARGLWGLLLLSRDNGGGVQGDGRVGRERADGVEVGEDDECEEQHGRCQAGRDREEIKSFLVVWFSCQMLDWLYSTGQS